LVRDQVAPALARVLVELPVKLQTWLCVLANPLLPAEVNLRAALDSPALPAGVCAALAEVCARRAAWYRHIGAKQTGPAPVPAAGSWSVERPAVKAAVDGLLELAAAHATRHHSGKGMVARQETGRNKEAAWLLARLTELLQSHVAGG
jgi:hypothetical protein